MTQNLQILAYLESGKAISPLIALREFNSFRLSARIKNLRDAGHQIESKRVTKNKKRFAEYRLLK